MIIELAMDNWRSMRSLASLVGVALVLSTLLLRVNSECEMYTRCGECITQDPSCGWCNDIDVLMMFARNSSSTRPAQLCGTEEELQALGCANIINPDTTVNTENVPPADSNSFVSPTSATVSVRPGLPASFDITVTPPQSAAVDMYLLMDLSLTMQQNLNMLRALADTLVMRMRQLSFDFRIGFGSFIDKTVPPFADKFVRDFPCVADADLLRISREDCEPVYSFRHVLNFTSEVEELETVLNSSRLSASPDHGEALLDAMLQTALCQEELGWRPPGQSQRIIVAFTDGDYHYALDGKIGGILSRPSAMECRLDPLTHEYTDSHLYDYPSSAVISDVLNTNLITPIFAVPSQVRPVYDGLVNSIRSATVATLSADSSSIIALIEEQYTILSGTVVPILTPSQFEEGLNITVLPANECAPGSLRPSTSDICMGVNFPSSTMYTVQVSADPRVCQLQQPIQATIQFIRFGTVTVNISLQCDCDCAEPEEDSEVCNGKGRLECSTCVCNDNLIGGAVCECPLGITSQPDIGCIDPQDSASRVCNGQGTCNCGRCQCDPIGEDMSLVFQGPYCQFNPQSCPQARDANGDFRPCAGNGECTSSRCMCFEGFTGGACECPTDNSTCIRPGSGDGEVCSGEGQCICGQCVCDDYSENFGVFCDQCLPCRTSCSVVTPCVLCQVMEGLECDEGLQCDRIQINDINMTTLEDLKVCSLREGSCEVLYYLGTSVRGTEPMIQVFMDPSQSSLVTLGEGSSRCNPPTPIWPIFVGIILGTIFVGILVLVLWRCCTYLGEYLEYQQWAKSIQNETERSGENPLFLDPTSEYSNPRYRQVQPGKQIQTLDSELFGTEVTM